MGVHVSAYKSTVAATTITQLNAVTDIYSIDNNSYLFKQDRKCPVAMAIGGIIDHARINQPSLNIVSYPNIEPPCVATEPGSNAPVCLFGPVPLTIRGNEDAKVEAVNSANTSTATCALLFTYDNMVPMPQAPVFKLRGTASATLTAYAWTNISTVTYDSTLPVGTYSLVGITGISAGAIAVRAIIQGMYDRPGFPALTAEGQLLPEYFRSYGLGQLGTFTNTTLPQFEFFSASADTSETIYLHFCKIG